MKEVYIASGWFNPTQAIQLDQIKALLDDMKVSYFSPKDEALATSTDPQFKLKEIFDGNIAAIRQCQFVIANTQNKDMGTIFECGTAYMMGIPILYFAEGLTGPFNLMLAQSGYGVATSIEELRKLVTMFREGGGVFTSTGYKGQIE